ncbi:MAG: Lrp/AsnC family transcriptional regulator [Nanoarchaeota archaeon]|nr:Lrp/AsnC family transcriptional regulator [Nanoarchaeota archaeon]MBU1854968.1 Lrp/AsnC family transcriptional regulator [Nanoarchaeota archaeon]
MDKIDKIILAELANNCRQPLSKIGKTIRKSPQFVKYRLENLKEKTIKNIPIIIDFYSLGYQEVTALIKFDIIDPISEKIVIDHLFKMTETYKLVYLNGNYDLLVSFVVKNLSEIPRIKENLETFAKTNIIFLTNYSAKILSHNYLSEKYSEKKIILGSK